MGGERILVAGAGGFIGGHLVAALRARGDSVRAVDIKPRDAWFQSFDDVENIVLDLRDRAACMAAVRECSQVFNLAADMGGMGYIEHHRAECMLNVLINTHLLLAARDERVGRYLFASSACVYNEEKQRSTEPSALREEDAYPAMPEDGYGWEKLFGERMCRHFREDYGVPTRIARFHNVYGPHGTWRGGREKAPAAICRKVLEAMRSNDPTIEIWGDGRQSRSFLYIDDCIEGTLRLAASEVSEPINIGSSELVTVDRLVEIVEEIAGVRLQRRYRLDAPRGVAGRNSDNTRVRERLGWEPTTMLRDGIERTFRWIEREIQRV